MADDELYFEIILDPQSSVIVKGTDARVVYPHMPGGDECVAVLDGDKVVGTWSVRNISGWVRKDHVVNRIRPL